MLRANIMGNSFDLSDKFSALSQSASNFFGRVNSVSIAMNASPAEVKQNTVAAAPKPTKKTLQLVEGSRRKAARQQQIAAAAATANNTTGGVETTTKMINTTAAATTTTLGKRIRSQTGRRVGGAAAVKTFKCHLDSCAKIFNDRASLKKHMTVHGDKLVSSHATGRGALKSRAQFPPTHSTPIHNTHSQSFGQFQCTYEACEKRFLDNAKLKRHMLVHTVSEDSSLPL